MIRVGMRTNNAYISHMANLEQYLSQERGRQSRLARRLSLGAGTLSSIRNGSRRPSPDLAKRIEEATDGEVRATVLLGLEEAGSAFEPAPPHKLNDGRWSVSVRPDGSLVLPAEMVAAMGFGPAEHLLFHPQGDEARIVSSDKALRSLQAELRALVPSGVSVVEQFISDKRAEAARE